jgi:hypothetical protein
VSIEDARQEAWQQANAENTSPIVSVDFRYRGKYFRVEEEGLRSQCGGITVHISRYGGQSPSLDSVNLGRDLGIQVLTRDDSIPQGLWEEWTGFMAYGYPEDDEYHNTEVTEVNRLTRVITRQATVDEDCYHETMEGSVCDPDLPISVSYNTGSALRLLVLWYVVGEEGSYKTSYNLIKEASLAALRRKAPVVVTTNFGCGCPTERWVRGLIAAHQDGTLRLSDGVQFHWGLGSNPNEYFHDIAWVMFSPTNRYLGSRRT